MAAALRSLARPLARLYDAAWDARRRAYAAGLVAPHRVPARVVSVGNLTLGGTGKTTLCLWLAERARAAGLDAAVVCRRYRPGPGGRSDEELLLARRVGEERVYAGASKWRLAQRAAAEGRRLVLVDDGFSHWALARDLDIVLLDAGDPWGGGLLPAGRRREPLRALQRAGIVVISQADDAAAASVAARVARDVAPAAEFAAGRHRVTGVVRLDGAVLTPGGPAHVVTATGNPDSVVRTARAAGFAPVTLSAYRDHHWLTAREAARERVRAQEQAATLLLTAKDAVRWSGPNDGVAVLEVEWEWWWGGETVWARVQSGEETS